MRTTRALVTFFPLSFKLTLAPTKGQSSASFCRTSYVALRLPPAGGTRISVMISFDSRRTLAPRCSSE